MMPLIKEQAQHLLELADELESGKYKQGMGQLRNSRNEYCCLGVALDKYQKDTGKGKWVNDGQIQIGFDLNGVIRRGNLEGLPEVCEYYGFPDGMGLVLQEQSMTVHNDGRRTTYEIHRKEFPVMAKMIREYVGKDGQS